DPFGHKWTIATHVEDVSPEEMKRRAEADADLLIPKQNRQRQNARALLVSNSKHAGDDQDRRTGDSAVLCSRGDGLVVLRGVQLELSPMEEPGTVEDLANVRRSAGQGIE